MAMRIEYTIGKIEKGKESLPQLVEQNRFEKLILDKITDKDDKALISKRYKLISLSSAKSKETRQNLINKYKNIEKYDLYELNKYTPDYEIEEIAGIIEKCGYTGEDLQKDNTENGIVVDLKEKATFDHPCRILSGQ